eukprot:sb/3471585/
MGDVSNTPATYTRLLQWCDCDWEEHVYYQGNVMLVGADVSACVLSMCISYKFNCGGNATAPKVTAWLSNIRLRNQWITEYKTLYPNGVIPINTGERFTGVIWGGVRGNHSRILDYYPYSLISQFISHTIIPLLSRYARLVLMRQSKVAIAQTTQILKLTLQDLQKNGKTALGRHRATTYLR